MKVRVKTPSRIHITLIDLNGSIGRLDGGIGIALKSPSVEVTGRESDNPIVTGADDVERFRDVCKTFESISGKSVRLDVKSTYRSHVGLGSGTQISLAVGSIYNKLFDLKLSIQKIAEIIGRGGTSGIGVAAFESGGFIVDGGHSTKEKSSFKPSSASKARAPPVIFRHNFPDWKIVLLTPELSGFSGRDEIELFKANCPIPVEDVREISHQVLLKMIPSIIEEDITSLGESIWRVQQLGFKKAEIDQYGNLIRDLMYYLKDTAPVVGMSSTGPTIFAITDSNPEKIARNGVQYFKEVNIDCEQVITKARNSGAKISGAEIENRN